MRHFVLLTMAAFLASTAPAISGEHRAMLTEFLRNGGALPDSVSRCDLPEVPVIEDLLLSPPTLTEQDYRELVPKLGATEYGERKAASRKLENAGATALPWIKRDIENADDPEIRQRLMQARDRLQARPARIEQLRRVLASGYRVHADVLWKKRIDETPGKDGLDSRAVLFVSMLPVEVLKQRLAQTPEKRRLDVILSILFKHEPGAGTQLDEGYGGPGYTSWVEELRRLDAEDVLAVCRQLWTVELESPAKDGAYFWTYRAERAEGGRAANVIGISVDRSQSPSSIVHFHVYRETTFNREGFGPLLTWRDTKRNGKAWRTKSPSALKYLPTDE